LSQLSGGAVRAGRFRDAAPAGERAPGSAPAATPKLRQAPAIRDNFARSGAPASFRAVRNNTLQQIGVTSIPDPVPPAQSRPNCRNKNCHCDASQESGAKHREVATSEIKIATPLSCLLQNKTESRQRTGHRAGARVSWRDVRLICNKMRQCLRQIKRNRATEGDIATPLLDVRQGLGRLRQFFLAKSQYLVELQQAPMDCDRL
jgi:hypothetical protein